MVAHTDRGDRTRIISARELTRQERVKNQHEMSGLILTASCYPQIVTLSDDAGYQTGINDVVSSIIVIWMTEMLAAGCKGQDQRIHG